MSKCLRSWEFFAATTKNISCVVIRFFWNSKRVVCVFSALRHMCNLVAMIIGHWWWVGRRLLAIHQRSSHPLDRMEIGIIGIVIVITINFRLHLTSSSDQLDRLENSLALEMVLVKRGEYGEKSWEENKVSCSECFIYLKGLRHTAFPSIDSFDLNLRGRNVEIESGSQALEFQKKQINKFFAIIIKWNV